MSSQSFWDGGRRPRGRMLTCFGLMLALSLAGRPVVRGDRNTGRAAAGRRSVQSRAFERLVPDPDGATFVGADADEPARPAANLSGGAWLAQLALSSFVETIEDVVHNTTDLQSVKDEWLQRLFELIASDVGKLTKARWAEIYGDVGNTTFFAEFGMSANEVWTRMLDLKQEDVLDNTTFVDNFKKQFETIHNAFKSDDAIWYSFQTRYELLFFSALYNNGAEGGPPLIDASKLPRVTWSMLGNIKTKGRNPLLFETKEEFTGKVSDESGMSSADLHRRLVEVGAYFPAPEGERQATLRSSAGLGVRSSQLRWLLMLLSLSWIASAATRCG